jgi:Leucine-rich repeat (LRR) protein
MSVLDLHCTTGDPSLGIAPEGVVCKDMNEIAERIAKVKNTVKKIIFDNQRSLTEIPPVLGECKLIQELNISHTSIKQIPDFLFTLPSLRSLSCCCTELHSFPAGIFKAKKLEFLHMRINKDWKLPEEITSLQNLKYLFLDLYSDTALPQTLGSLSNLTELTLAIKYDEGSVPCLPDSFNNHPVLEKLSLNDPFYRNRKTFNLEQATQILSSCASLESLKLSGIAVGNGHQNLSWLTGLKDLELRHLLVEGNIFDSIAGLNKLEKLCILGSEFKINEIPDIFADLKDLKTFSFAGNMISSLPPSVYSLENLTTLEIGSTGISSLDDKIINLKNLENIQIYDNILESLPRYIFSLPKLKVLNIEENIFSPEYIIKLKENINSLARKGQKIEFMHDRQGHRQMVKKLRAIKDTVAMDIPLYARYCLNAIAENPYAIKYVNMEKFIGSPHYASLCMAAVRKTSVTLEIIEPQELGKNYYSICMEAAKNQDIGSNFKLIKSQFLSDSEFIKVCIEAALNNRSADFIDNLNDDAFYKRFSRDIYERVCWVAVLQHPKTIEKMIKTTEKT